MSQYLRIVIIKVLRFYQITISFDHGLFKSLYPYGFCRFSPTCSEYAIQAITKYGIIKGGLLALRRLIRCNPWSKGGYDPVK